MKRVLFLLFFATLAVFLTVGVGAETYEADGGSTTVYEFPSEDCNRTIVVRCVDESGTLLKTVTCYTSAGKQQFCISVFTATMWWDSKVTRAC